MIRYPCQGPAYESRLAASIAAANAIPEGGVPFETFTCAHLHWHRRFVLDAPRCTCGHERRLHERPGNGACWVDDCDCWQWSAP